MATTTCQPGAAPVAMRTGMSTGANGGSIERTVASVLVGSGTTRKTKR